MAFCYTFILKNKTEMQDIFPFIQILFYYILIMDDFLILAGYSFCLWFSF